MTEIARRLRRVDLLIPRTYHHLIAESRIGSWVVSVTLLARASASSQPSYFSLPRHSTPLRRGKHELAVHLSRSDRQVSLAYPYKYNYDGHRRAFLCLEHSLTGVSRVFDTETATRSQLHILLLAMISFGLIASRSFVNVHDKHKLMYLLICVQGSTKIGSGHIRRRRDTTHDDLFEQRSCRGDNQRAKAVCTCSKHNYTIDESSVSYLHHAGQLACVDIPRRDRPFASSRSHCC